MDREGWRQLADVFRAFREARWAGLSPEATAEKLWPQFRDAVTAAADEYLSDPEGPTEDLLPEAGEAAEPGAEGSLPD